MATSTFDKVITIDQAAAERLAAVLAEPIRPTPEIDSVYRQNEEVWQCFLRTSGKLPMSMDTKKH
jgi:hypothetical protein